MKKLILFVASIFLIGCMSCIPNMTDPVDPLTCLKTISDAQEVSETISSLAWVGKGSNHGLRFEEFSGFKTDIDRLLTDLSQNGSGFRKNWVPIELKITDENQRKVGLICEKLAAIHQEIKNYAKSRRLYVAPEQIFIADQLSSDNPACYYSCINHPTSTIKLKDHVLKDRIEFISFQDRDFLKVMVDSDESLWEMWSHSAGIRMIMFFGADLNKAILDRLKLNRLKGLTVLVLAENDIRELPNYISSMVSLRYLNLACTGISHLPEDIGKLSELKYLDLGRNEFSDKEKDRIREQLPNTKILF